MQEKNIPLLDCPKDYLIGDASGKVMNEYGRFPCKIQCGVFALLLRGSARATINISQYEFHANDAMLLEPGSFMLIHECSEDALVQYILFSSSFLEKNSFGGRLTLSSLKLTSPQLHLREEHAEVFKGLVALLNQASNCMPSMLSSEKMVYVLNILKVSFSSIENHNEIAIHPQDRKTEIYQEYCQLVLKQYREWHHVSQYADAMRITLPHLCTTIRQVSDRTAGDIIIDAILTDAKAQLKITNLQIKEIGLSLGFENVAFFNRFFKTHTGVTPKAYRNS